MKQVEYLMHVLKIMNNVGDESSAKAFQGLCTCLYCGVWQALCVTRRQIRFSNIELKSNKHPWNLSFGNKI